MSLVLDASAILPLAMPDEDAEYSNAVLRQIAVDGEAYVPPIFWDELVNVLAIATRQQRLELRDAEKFLMTVSFELPIVTRSPESRLAVLQAAHKHQITGYDAVYLILAQGVGAQIATHDRELSGTAERAGCGWFEPPNAEVGG